LDAQYIEWHSLDHHPEQYGIDGIRLGQRWVSTPSCRAVRAVEHGRFDDVDHVMQYHFADPLQSSLEEFFALGATLHKAGRMPLRIPAVELGGYELVDRCASAHALIRAEVVPWRPARGAYFIVEHGGENADLKTLCEIPGVAGAWRYRGGAFHERLVDTTDLTLTVLYLDDEVVATGVRIGAALSEGWEGSSTVAMLAAPFESIQPWAWDRALPG
jgi:hypothetical protein